MDEENGNFGNVIFRTGNWVLTDECIYWDKKEHHPYPISKERFWEVRLDNGLDKFDWPLHIVEKSWLTIEDIYHFDIIFFYALDYYKDLKPKNNKASVWKTLELQQKFLEDKKENFEVL